MNLYELLEIDENDFTEYDIIINKSFRDLLCVVGF